MPGHIKKSSGPDPDPSPWLEVKKELKARLLEKPYDMKKSCWVVNKGEEGGYLEGLVEKDMMVADWEVKGSKMPPRRSASRRHVQNCIIVVKNRRRCM